MSVTPEFISPGIVRITFSGGSPTPSAQDSENYSWFATTVEGFPPSIVLAPIQPVATYVGVSGNTVLFSLVGIYSIYNYWVSPSGVELPEGGFWVPLTVPYGAPILMAGVWTWEDIPLPDPDPDPDPEEPSLFEEVTLSLENSVVSTDKYVPLTGVHSPEEEITGWVWDKRLMESILDDSTRYLKTIGGHSAGLKDGTKSTFWQSGSILNNRFLNITKKRLFRENFSWTPRIESGKYSILFQPKNLYSDFSHTDKIENSDPASSIALREDCRQDSISIVLYKRDSNFINWPWDVYTYVEEFTGELPLTGTRLVSEDDDGSILWGNLSTRHKEYRIIDGTVYLNTNASRIISADDISLLEYLGKGNSTGRDCFTEFFPLEGGTVRIFVLTGDAWRELTEVESLNFSSLADDHFSVDEDLGIISLGGYQAPNLVLRKSLDTYDDEVSCYSDDSSFQSYPRQGVIRIGEEDILYYAKSRDGFLDCVRGHNLTVATGHSMGDIVSDTVHGKPVKKTEKVYAAYTAIPRIEYEITNSSIRTANKNPLLSLKPVHNTKTNNIIQISPSEKHISELVLEVDKPLIALTTYGPIYYGSDFARLTARALDSLGLPVEGVNITIELLSNTGTVNGSKKYTALSNTLGETYSIFNAPYDWDSISKTIIDISHEGGGTVLDVEPLPLGLAPEDITLYQVLKHDRIYGTVGQAYEILAYTPGSPPAITINAIFDDPSSQWESNQSLQDPPHGSCRGCSFVDIKFVNGSGNAMWVRRKIMKAMDSYADIGGVQKKMSTVFVLDTNITLDPTVWTAELCYAVEKDAAIWTGDLSTGLPVILYEWNDTVLHPTTLSLGAYYPLRPDGMTQEQLLFSGRQLPFPQPFDIESNLGGYLIVTSDVATIRAHCTDPVSGKVRVSNKVKIRLDIPSYLNGVDSSGALPIPYGFSFIAEDFNVGSGLGGANFLTINPKAEGVNAFSLNINIG